MGLKDYLVKTFQPDKYWSDKAESTAVKSGTQNGDLIPVLPFEAPRSLMHGSTSKSVTLGDLLPDRDANRAIRINFDPLTAAREGFDRSVWAFACMDLISSSFAQLRYRVERREKGVWIPAHDSNLQGLLDNPNPFISRDVFYTIKALNLYLQGNALDSIVRVQGRPFELWPHDPKQFKPIPSKTKHVRAFKQSVSGLPDREVKYEDMLHMMIPDPNNIYWGRSPLATAIETIMMDNASRKWNSEAMDNRTVSDGVFSVTQKLTQPQYDTLRKQIREQHQGAANAREPWLLSSGAMWTPMDKTPVEMDFVSSRMLNREEICAAFRVPPTQVGIYDKATLNNFETGRRIFWEDTIVPLGEKAAAVYSMRLAREFSKLEGKEYRVIVDTSEIPALWKAYKERLDAADQAKKMGFSLNAVNDRFKLGFDKQEESGEEE